MDFPPSAQVIPDIERNSLDLFLYVNRYGNHQIVSPAAVSYRFSFSHQKVDRGAFVARFLRLGIAGHPLADITARGVLSGSEAVSLLPASGEVLVVRSSDWLDPEGSKIGSMFRWLSGTGKFIVLGPEKEGCTLSARLSRGPDLHGYNAVRIIVGGKAFYCPIFPSHA